MMPIRMGLMPGLLLALALAVAGCGGDGKSNGVASLGDGQATATTSPGAARTTRSKRWPTPGACASTA
jgi:hypothetical protein